MFKKILLLTGFLEARSILSFDQGLGIGIGYGDGPVSVGLAVDGDCLKYFSSRYDDHYFNTSTTLSTDVSLERWTKLPLFVGAGVNIVDESWNNAVYVHYLLRVGGRFPITDKIHVMAYSAAYFRQIHSLGDDKADQHRTILFEMMPKLALSHSF